VLLAVVLFVQRKKRAVLEVIVSVELCFLLVQPTLCADKKEKLFLFLPFILYNAGRNEVNAKRSPANSGYWQGKEGHAYAHE